MKPPQKAFRKVLLLGCSLFYTLFNLQPALSESLENLESFQNKTADAVKGAQALSEETLALDFLAGKLRQGVWQIKTYPDFEDENWRNIKPTFKTELCERITHRETLTRPGDGTCLRHAFGRKTITKPESLRGAKTLVRIRGVADDDLKVISGGSEAYAKGEEFFCPGAGSLPNNSATTFELDESNDSFIVEGRDTSGEGASYDLTVCFEPLGASTTASVQSPLVPVREMFKRKSTNSLGSCEPLNRPEFSFDPLTPTNLASETEKYCLNESPKPLRHFFVDSSGLGSLGVPAETNGGFAYISVPRGFPENYFSDPQVQIARNRSSFAPKKVEFIKWIGDEEQPLRVAGVTAKVGGITADIFFTRSENTPCSSDDCPNPVPDPTDPTDPDPTDPTDPDPSEEPSCELQGTFGQVRANTPFQLRLLVRGVVHSAEIGQGVGANYESVKEIDLSQVNIDLPFDNHIIHTETLNAPIDNFDESPEPYQDGEYEYANKTYSAFITGPSGTPVTCTKTISIKKYVPNPVCQLAVLNAPEPGFNAGDSISLKLFDVSSAVVAGALEGEGQALTNSQISAAKTPSGAALSFIKDSENEQIISVDVFTAEGSEPGAPDDGVRRSGSCEVRVNLADSCLPCPDGTCAPENSDGDPDDDLCPTAGDICPFANPDYHQEIILQRFTREDYEPILPTPSLNPDRAHFNAPTGHSPDCNPRAHWKTLPMPGKPRADRTTGAPILPAGSICVPKVTSWKNGTGQCTESPLPFYQKMVGSKCKIAKAYACEVTQDSCLTGLGAELNEENRKWVKINRAKRCEVPNRFSCFPAKKLKADAVASIYRHGLRPVTMFFGDTRRSTGTGTNTKKVGTIGRQKLISRTRFKTIKVSGGSANVTYTRVIDGHLYGVAINRNCGSGGVSGASYPPSDVLCSLETELRAGSQAGRPEYMWATIGPIHDPDCQVLDYHEDRYFHYRTGGCFTADTPITMANGKEKRVSEIRVGEYVFNPHYRTGIRVKKVVKGPEPKPLFEVALNGKKIKVTEDHPFFTERGWVQTVSLKKGDKLFGEGKGKVVEGIKKLPYKKPVDVWNFELDSEDPLAHIIKANGIPTGDLVTQLELKKRAKKLP